jgi:hypothetical protein
VVPLANILNPSGVKYRERSPNYSNPNEESLLVALAGIGIYFLEGNGIPAMGNTHRNGPNYQVPWMGRVIGFLFFALTTTVNCGAIREPHTLPPGKTGTTQRGGFFP